MKTLSKLKLNKYYGMNKSEVSDLFSEESLDTMGMSEILGGDFSSNVLCYVNNVPCRYVDSMVCTNVVCTDALNCDYGHTNYNSCYGGNTGNGCIL